MNIAIQFNNSGVTFHAMGQRSDARAMFKAALEVMTIISGNERKDDHAYSCEITKNAFIQNAMNTIQQAQQDIQMNRSESTAPLQDIQMKRSESAAPFSVDAIQPHDFSTPFRHTSHNTSSPFVYQQPFKMKIASSSDDDTSDTIKLMAGAVILYNMALIGHLKWLEKPHANEAIKKVLKFYKMAHDIMQQEKLESSLFHLHLALLNNMGQIEHDLCRYEVARTHMWNMLSAIVHQRASNMPSIRPDDAITDLNLEEFLLNATLLQSPSLARAA